MTRPRRAVQPSRSVPSQLIRSAQTGIAAFADRVSDSTRSAVTSVTQQLGTGQPRKDLVRTGIAALTVTALGLGAAGALAATSSASGAASSAASGAASSAADQPVTSTSPAFERRAPGTSRDAERQPTRSAEQQRASELSQARTKVNQAQRDAAIGERAKELADESDDTDKAAQLLKRQAEEKARAQATAPANAPAGTQVGARSGAQTGAPSEQPAVGQGGKVMPLNNYRIAAQFGAVGAWARYHTGVDFSAPLGTPIYAIATGVVTHVGSGGGAGGWAGSYVVVQHADGYSTLYAHMNPAISVSVGQQVGTGDHLGNVGLTGRTFGAHCHVELYPPGTTPGDVYAAVDPLPWINAG